MAKRIPMIDGDEMDALTRWKNYLKWRAGERKRIKAKYNRRERKQARLTMRALDGAGLCVDGKEHDYAPSTNRCVFCDTPRK